MCFVHQQERGAALSLRLQEHALKSSEARRLTRRRALDLEFREEHFQEFFAAESWIKNERRGDRMIVRSSFGENLKCGVNNGGLARPDGPSHQDKALAAHDRFNHCGQRNGMRFREVKEPRI